MTAARGWHLTREADADLLAILRWTSRHFGRVQRNVYAALIRRSLTLLVEDPERGGTRRREEVRPRLRSFHIGLAGTRRQAAAHILYFRAPARPDDPVLILRILHQSMDAAPHLAVVPE